MGNEVLSEIKIKAPAKINIGLRVIRKRSDRYHDIETVFYPINLSDELEIARSGRHEFYSNVPLQDDANLCLRALHFFCERTGIHAEVKMTLNKKIPIGAGLGGGSSDAAAVLIALQELYGHPLCSIEMSNIAMELGADVPFFLRKIPTFATGKGEVIEPIDYSVGQWILTATPDVSVSTALAYSIVVPCGPLRTSLRDELLSAGENYSAYKDLIVNDFEAPVFAKFPVIGDLKKAFYAAGATFALMSGSGSSVYGFFGDENSARRASDSLSDRFPLRALDLTPPAS